MGKRLFIVSLHLVKHEGTTIITKPTLSWRIEASEEAALGATVIWAAKEFPGFSVHTHICHAIPDEHIAAAYAELGHPTATEKE